jgi:hypothetical protein
MIRLIILVAIFFAVYPYIGTGFEQFTKDVNVSAIADTFNSITEFVKGIFNKFKS